MGHRITRSSPLEISDVRHPQYLLLRLELTTSIAEGTIYTARILTREDLDRQIVRSSTCEILIPEYEMTLPSTTRGQLTTVEGLIRDVVSDLSLDQPLRRIQDEEGYTKIEALLDKLRLIIGDSNDDEDPQAGRASKKADVPMPTFTIKLDDPAGNSFIEFIGSVSDPKWNMRTYRRTLQQNVALGLVAADDEQGAAVVEKPTLVTETNADGDPVTQEEIFIFPGSCSSCGHPSETLMKRVNIPYFKVGIVAFPQQAVSN